RLRLLLLERQAAETLVELSDAAALIDLALTARPSRVAGGVDVQRHRVAFAAPGGARFEHGAVGHLHLDRVVVGMNIGLHGSSPSWARPVPTGQLCRESGALKRGAPLWQAWGCGNLARQASGGSATIAVKLTSQGTLPSTLARPRNLHTRARFWTRPTFSSRRPPGSTGARNLGPWIAMK